MQSSASSTLTESGGGSVQVPVPANIQAYATLRVEGEPGEFTEHFPTFTITENDYSPVKVKGTFNASYRLKPGKYRITYLNKDLSDGRIELKANQVTVLKVKYGTLQVSGTPGIGQDDKFYFNGPNAKQYLENGYLSLNHPIRVPVGSYIVDYFNTYSRVKIEENQTLVLNLGKIEIPNLADDVSYDVSVDKKNYDHFLSEAAMANYDSIGRVFDFVLGQPLNLSSMMYVTSKGARVVSSGPSAYMNCQAVVSGRWEVYYSGSTLFQAGSQYNVYASPEAMSYCRGMLDSISKNDFPAFLQNLYVRNTDGSPIGRLLTCDFSKDFYSGLRRADCSIENEPIAEYLLPPVIEKAKGPFVSVLPGTYQLLFHAPDGRTSTVNNITVTAQ